VTTSLPPLSAQRCFNHSFREAAVRCPQCTRFFCRECVAEHEDRLVCASCLRSLATSATAKRGTLSSMARTAQVLLGVLIAWFVFFMIGDMLLRLPASFHDSSVWRTPWIQTQ
jgi:hypothetical protein